jgi:hypothetical protein
MFSQSLMRIIISVIHQILISVLSESDDNNNKCDTSVHRSIQPTLSSYNIKDTDNII